MLTTPQKKLSVDRVAAGLREFNGNLAAVARRHGVTRQAVWIYIQRHPKLKAVQHDTKESMKDNAESALHAAVLRGEAWAVKWYLATQAKDRGYVERQEHRKVGHYSNEELLAIATGGGPRAAPPAGDGSEHG